MPEPLKPHERPLVAVLVPGPGSIGTWYPGELRQWTRRDDGWWGNVEYSTGPAQNRLDTFHEDQIRRLPDD